MSRVVKYEIVNELDPYSISSSSPLHAAAAVILASDGNFALRTRELFPKVICPPFNESGEEGMQIWWNEQRSGHWDWPADFFEWCEQEKRGIADALETVTLEAQVHTTEIDFAARARTLAAEMRAKIEKEKRR